MLFLFNEVIEIVLYFTQSFQTPMHCFILHKTKYDIFKNNVQTTLNANDFYSMDKIILKIIINLCATDESKSYQLKRFISIIANCFIKITAAQVHRKNVTLEHKSSLK